MGSIITLVLQMLLPVMGPIVVYFMRKAQMKEETIQKFLEAVKQAQAEVSSTRASEDEAEAERRLKEKLKEGAKLDGSVEK
jgi:ABC-type nitrate/sulfonate/bicarbonate transport system substrate-binding protein